MKEKEQFLNPIITAIRFGIVGLAFLTPLFFLPITSEFYQFNKLALVVMVASILLILWGVRMGIEGKMRIVRTPLDVPLLLFAVVFILATVFSVDRYVSIAGFYLRFHGGLVSVLAYIVIYFVAVSNLDKQSRDWTIWSFIASSTILALASIAHFFGYFVIPADYAKSRSWTPIGNSASLTLYLALVLPLVLGVMLSIKNRTLQTLALVAAIILVIPIILFKLIGPLLALLAGLGAAAVISPRLKIDKDHRSLLGIFAVVAVVVAVVSFVPELRGTILEPLMAKKETFNITPDKTLPLGSAWRISTSSIGQRPFLGVGPGTFAYSFTAFKGPELNSDNFWNLRFDLSGNEYLTVLSTLGIIGLITFVIVIAMFLRSLTMFSIRSDTVKSNPISIFLLASLVVFAVGIFFQDTTVSIWVFFVLLAALSFSYLKDWGVKNVEEMDVKFVALTAGAVAFVSPSDRNRDSSLGTAFTIIGVAAFLTILYFGVPSYQAEMAYQKALRATAANKAVETHDSLVAARNLNPNRDTYRRTLVVIDRLLAINLSKKEKKTDKDNQNIAALVNEAINEGLRITGYQGRGLNSYTIEPKAGSSPLNVANWEALSAIYSSLNLTGELKKQNSANEINVARQAVALDPRNVVLIENFGNILLKNNLLDDAIKAYEQAIQVRPAYASAHYNLASALRQKGDNPARVVLELETTQALLPKDSPDKDRIANELEEAKKKRDEATSSAKKN